MCLQSATLSFTVCVCVCVCVNWTALRCLLQPRIHMFDFSIFPLLLPPLMVVVFKSQASSDLYTNDRFIFSPSTRLFYNRESISFSLSQTWWIWRVMPGLLRGVAGSQPLWPWLNVRVLNRGTLRQPGIRWLPELSLCVFVCHLLLAFVPLPHFFLRCLSLSSVPFIFLFLLQLHLLSTWHAIP